MTTLSQAKLCGCGCGVVVRRRFLPGHWGRGKTGAKRPTWKGGRSTAGRYVLVMQPDHPHTNSSGYICEHTLVAERALGRLLPKGSELHHVNGDLHDNRPANLVLCHDHAFHMMLHRRAHALAECGDVTYRKCWLCKEWGDPKSPRMRVKPKQKKRGGGEAYHRRCRQQYDKGRRQ